MTARYVDQLRPDIRTEKVVLGNGQTITVYRCPFPSEGPFHLREDRVQLLRYMYGHFVFSWPGGTTQVDVGHGTVDRFMPLWTHQPIDTEWCSESLIRFGRSWTRNHLDKYTREVES